MYRVISTTEDLLDIPQVIETQKKQGVQHIGWYNYSYVRTCINTRPRINMA